MNSINIEDTFSRFNTVPKCFRRTDNKSEIVHVRAIIKYIRNNKALLKQNQKTRVYVPYIRCNKLSDAVNCEIILYDEHLQAADTKSF